MINVITITIHANNGLINNLAAYIMERRNVVAVLKNTRIDIDPIKPISVDDVIDVIKNFMIDNKIEGFVRKDGNNIKVIILTNNNNNEKRYILTCPHCGKIGIYEEEMDTHIKAHYIGF